MAEVLRSIIGVFREQFKAASLTDAVIFSKYALAALVVDEVCKEVRRSVCRDAGKLGLGDVAAPSICSCSVVPATHCYWHVAPAQGLAELTDRLSIQKAISMRLAWEPAPEKSKGALARFKSSKQAAPAGS